MHAAKISLIGLAGAIALLGAAQAQSPRRQVGAHVHGASKLNLAIEGQTVSMELTAPAQDIVGFETRPRTEKQRAAVEQAEATLRDPLKLFTLPPAAGCTVASASAELVFEDADADRGSSAEGDTAHKAEHAEFQGRYSLLCTNAAGVQQIDFPYFKSFPRADEIEVQAISQGGQKSFEVKRARPRLSLRNLAS